MDEVMGVVLFAIGFYLFLALIIVLIVKGVKKSKQNLRTCPECKKYYFYEDDISLNISDLKWEKRTKHETKGDYEYEITYKIFYRIVEFVFTCSKCGHVKTVNKRFDVYSSDSNYSQSDEEEEAVLLSKIEKYLGKQAFDRKLNSQKNEEIINKAKNNKQAE